MPTSPSAKKQMRQSAQRRQRNRSVRSAVKTRVRKFLATLDSGDAEAARGALREAVRMLDKAVSRGVLHRNTADRHKSRLAARFNQLQRQDTQP
ncbi:MAG: 30S ribosomal protein S20 [Candidatus Brocadiia bacterium]